MKLDFDYTQSNITKETEDASKITPLFEPSVSLPSTDKNEAGIMLKILHQRTEFRIYPNGTIFPGKTQTWFENSTYAVKKKEVKKAAPSKKIEKQQEEVY